MIRQTSIDAYRQITENGLLARREMEVYETIFKHGKLTIKETCKILSNRPETSISPIFARLVKRGVIDTPRVRPCSVTGNNVHEWEVTDRLPVKIEKKRSISKDELLGIMRDARTYVEACADNYSEEGVLAQQLVNQIDSALKDIQLRGIPK